VQTRNGCDPCEDFFQYACGNFGKFYPIPNDRSSYAAYNMVDEYIENVLRTMLDKAGAVGSQRTPNEQKIGDFYTSCTRTDVIDENGLKPLQSELARIAALRSKDELPELLAHYQLINATAFFAFSGQRDFTDARKQIAVVDQGGLGLPDRDFYFRTGDADQKLRDSMFSTSPPS
jgi:putative endopeptidase